MGHQWFDIVGMGHAVKHEAFEQVLGKPKCLLNVVRQEVGMVCISVRPRVIEVANDCRDETRNVYGDPYEPGHPRCLALQCAEGREFRLDACPIARR